MTLAASLTSILHLLPPEMGHSIALQALSLAGRLPGGGPVRGSSLTQRLWNLDFPNPVGLAAGFDKDGVAMDGVFRLGFGFVEIGSVTPLAQAGNPKPRLFRLRAEQAVINRMGFNSVGRMAVRQRLQAWRARHGKGQAAGGPLGINLGKNKESPDAVADYAAGVRALGPFADYIVVNVSSPNTPGLRDLQAADELARILNAVAQEQAGFLAEGDRRSPSVLVKVAPDLSADARRAIARLALEAEVGGLIISNTTVSRPLELSSRAAGEAGGLSGRPLLALSNEVLADFYRLTEGRLPLIGVGGVSSGAEAYGKIRAGASLVQLYSALVYNGPGLVRRIITDLADLLAQDGFSHVGQAVGADHRQA